MRFTILFFVFLFFSGITTMAQPRQFTGKPIYEIEARRAGTSLGTITVELFPHIAPLHVANFDSLVGVNFFDTTAFHRVIPGFMIQGGDPNSRHGPDSTWGLGDPSQPTVNAEFSPAKHVRGILSAARDTDTNSANSQFFICVAAAPWLNNQYSVYGRVTAGMDVVDTIVLSPTDANDKPLQKIEMFVTAAGSNDTIPGAPVHDLPANASFSASTLRTLKWIAASDGILYRVQVSTDSSFQTIFKTAVVGTNTYTVTGLQPNTTYYWRVQTNNGGHTGPYSPRWSFSVSGLGVAEADNIYTWEIFPNPAKDQLCIHLTEATGTYLFELFDVQGKVIKLAQLREKNNWLDTINLPPGLYVVRITGADISSYGKLVIE